MKVVLGKQEIELIPNEVKAAKRIVSAMLRKTKEESVDRNVPSLYFTAIIVAYLMSNDLIKAFTPEAMATILEAAAKAYKQKDES